MSLLRTPFARFGLVALLAFLGSIALGCGTAADPLESGAICAPATSSCPSKTQLAGASEGRNLLDLALVNRGPEADVTFDISFQAPGDTASGGTDGTSQPDAGLSEGAGTIFPLRYDLAPGARITDRFRSSEIFSRNELYLEIGCAPESDCDVRGEFVLFTERAECNSDDDCAGQRRCNASMGLCVNCLSDDDCRSDQSCDEQTGRCLPPGRSGCSIAPGSTRFGASWLFALLVLFAAHRLRRSTFGRLFPLALCTFFALVVSSTPTDLQAKPPGSTVSIGTGPRWVVGPVGTDVKRGLGVELQETVRWRHVGVTAWIETNYFVTTQPPPPSDNELQIFGFGIGPRAFYAIDPVEFTAGAGYQRLGFAPNALVRSTGTNANFNSVGGSFAAGYRWSQFVVRLGGQFHPIFGVDGSLLSINASFGISTR